VNAKIVCSIRLGPQLKDVLEQCAHANKTTVTRIMTLAVEHYLELPEGARPALPKKAVGVSSVPLTAQRTIKFTPARRAVLVQGVRCGLFRSEDVLAHYGITLHQLHLWEQQLT